MPNTHSSIKVILSLGRGCDIEQADLTVMTRFVESHEGWLFRVEIGGVWASFPHTRGALSATSEILARFPDTKAGLHKGEVVLTSEGDLLGNALSVAKRLETVAQLGTALMTSGVYQELPGCTYFANFSEPKDVQLKGLGCKQAVEMLPCIELRERAFKFLDSYNSEDTKVFFGRETEIQDLLERLEAQRWVTLYGDSGVGKSSVLGAGVFPLFEQRGYRIHILRCLSDPLELLRDLFAQSGGELKELILRHLDQGEVSGLLFCFDQFEEFFLRVSQPDRMKFWKALANFFEHPNFDRVRWVFSLREDFLAEMGEAETEISDFLNHYLRLNSLSREQARLCVVGPAQVCGRWVEPRLVEAVLDDLYRDGIEPPELQIVMDHLDRTREPGSSWLRLEAYERAGGFQEIIVDYLYEVLDGVADRDLAKALLLALVSDKDTKQARSFEELRKLLDTDKDSLRKVTGQLIDARLLRQLTEQQMLELSHEYLLEEIQSWADQADLATRYARLALESELESWQQLGSLMDRSRLLFLNSQSEHLKPSTEGVELLLRASVVHGTSPSVWASGPEHSELLLKLLEKADDGIVQRRLLAELYNLELGDRGFQLVLDRSELCGNPNSLKDLSMANDARRQAIVERVKHRFFGPDKMVKIPAGVFQFGSSQEQKRNRKASLHRYLHSKIDSEAEIGKVNLEDFWLDICPVTNFEYAEFQPGHLHRFPDDQGDHPVVSLSLLEAQSYAAWLGKELPTEQEWEKGARGTDGRFFPWGNEYLSTHLNSGDDEFKQTTKVTEFPKGQSPYGCLDMAGNVWEWTISKWSDQGPFIVQKGGSTLSGWAQQHCSSRMDAFPDFVLRWTGFRLKSSSQGSKSL